MRLVQNSWAPVVVTLVFCIVSMVLMQKGILERGSFRHYLFSSVKFGVPLELKNRGFDEFYKMPEHLGWDGQFYFYIANDPLGQKDTRSHIDADAYRYQRIGIPAIAAILSKVLFFDWVSPVFYYLVNLIIYLTATWLLSLFLVKNGYSSWISCIWSLSALNLMTTLNGLPDAAADGALVIGTIFWLNKKEKLSLLFMLIAALSREAYIVLPAVLFMSEIFGERRPKVVLGLTIVGLLFLSWHLFIFLRFGSSSSQAIGILDWPGFGIVKDFISGLEGKHSIWGGGIRSKLEALGLLLYSIFLVIALRIILPRTDNPIFRGFLVLVLLCFCLGHTVTVLFSGYMKAASIFYFVIPIAYVSIQKAIPMKLMIALFAINFYFLVMFWDARLRYDPYLLYQ